MRKAVEQLFEKPSQREWVLLALSGAAIAWSVWESRVNNRLQEVSIHDDKTGLFTEEYFRKEVKRRTGGKRRVSDVGRMHALLFCDLDRFKEVNDQLGHLAADKKALIPAAHAVMDVIRSESGDDMAGRFGGDEFMVFLSDVQTMDNALRIARYIQTEINIIHPFVDTGGQFQMGVSIGCVMYDSDIGLDTALQQADTALYAAKAIGQRRNLIIPYDDDVERLYGKFV